MKETLKAINRYYNFIRVAGRRLPEGHEDSPYPHTDGYYLDEIDFFISVERWYNRINHLAQLKRLYESDYLDLRPSHLNWLIRMRKLAAKQIAECTHDKLHDEAPKPTQVV